MNADNNIIWPVESIRINRRYINTVSFILFSFLLLCLTRQVPFSILSGFIAPLLVLTCVVTSVKGVYRQSIKSFSLFFIFLIFLSGYSISQGNDISLNIRFFIILLLINLIPTLRFEEGIYLKTFNVIFTIQAIIVIILGFSLPFIFELESYLPFRHFITSNGWGDIYTYNGYIYKIQIVGNALLPFALFLSFFRYKKGECSGLNVCIYILAIFFCGNLAFYLFTVAFFIGFYVLDSNLKIKASISTCIYFILFFVCMCVFLFYTYNMIVMKSTGDVSSIGTRFDQAQVLINDMSYNISSVLLGNGLGHTIDVKTMARDYTDNIYFELQFLYILNQIGFVGMVMLTIFHLKLIFNFLKNKKIILIYLCYIGYALINPYMFDSNHCVVLILLMSLSHRYVKAKIDAKLDYTA